MNLRRLLDYSVWLYLAGVACLIVRKNSYSWPIKRSSDIFFLVSGLVLLPVILKNRDRLKKLKIVFWPIVFFSGGVLLATIIRIGTGHPTTNDGLLEAFRVFEVIALLLLTGSLTLLSEKFVPGVLFAQLSTLLYTAIFLFPYSSWSWMYRFEWLENWPSNTSYYLILSLLFLSSLLFFAWKKRDYRFTLPTIGLIPLSAFFLWSQTRASWLGFGIALIVLIVLWFRQNKKAALYTVLSLGMAGALGLAILPPITQGDVIHRIFPGIQLAKERSRAPVSPSSTPPLVNIEDPTRLTLWGIYTDRLVHEPWGQGVEYDAVNIGHGPQGPHNTLLETMVLGGFFAVTGFLELLYLAFKNLRSKREETEKIQIYRWTLLAALLGLFIASFFDNLSTFRLLWILLALAIFFERKEVV